MQAAPVHQHEHCGNHRERIGGCSIVENPRNAFECRQRRFLPYVGKLRPVPARWRSQLTEVEIRPTPNRRECKKLENKIAKPQRSKCDPDSLVAPKTAKTVAKRSPDGVQEHYQRVAAAEAQ